MNSDDTVMHRFCRGQGAHIHIKAVERKLEYGIRAFMYCQDEAFSRKCHVKNV